MDLNDEKSHEEPAPSADEERAATLAEQVGLSGSTGLLHTAYAGSGAAGTFRVGFMMDYFHANGFLCSSGTPCNKAGDNDSLSHVGGFFTLNATPFSFLEAYAGLRTYANSDSLGTPQLLQVLGDTTIGLKAFTPFRLGDVFRVGGDLRVLFLNGAGDVGPAGAGTSAEINLLSSFDLRKLEGRGVGAPVRIHINFGYRVDDSGKLVQSFEQTQAANNPTLAGNNDRIPINRIDRYGLGINRVDFFLPRIGIDVPTRYVQPFAEWSIDVPYNRQGYECHSRTLSMGDECLALKDINNPNSGPPGFSAAPSRVTLGLRTDPFSGAFRGLSGLLAVDIGTSGTKTFVEEVAPQAPWTLYLGLGYAFDTREKEVPVAPPPPPAEVIPPPPEYYVKGMVKEKGTGAAVANAIVALRDPGASEPPFATDEGGHFLTRKLAPGAHTFAISADGYKPGACTADVKPPQERTVRAETWTAAPAGAPPTYGAPPGTPGAAPAWPGAPAPGAPPGWPGAAGAPAGAPPGAPGAAAPGGMTHPPQRLTGSFYTEVSCELEALPKKGAVAGTVTSSEGDKALAGVSLTLTDRTGARHNATTGSDGSFKFGDLPSGDAKITAEAKDHFSHTQELTVRPRETVKANLNLTKRPAIASARIVGNQIQITKQIHFETDQATILGDSDQLLEEIADVINKHPELQQIEIQGHTDNTGTPAHNKELSQARADSVRDWLVKRGGVDGSRLTAKGYGQERPLVPNITPGNRARNRRVQFIITQK